MSFINSLTNDDIFEIMCLRIQKSLDVSALFGDSFERVKQAVPPFLVGKRFPEMYLEFPLKGKPFLDVSVLYSELEPGIAINSEYAGECIQMLDTFSSMCKKNPDICCGFELDTSDPVPAPAAVHFEHYMHTDLVIPFCESLGQRSYGELYLKAFRRLDPVWPPSFFGMFRGRSDAPLRICGYMAQKEKMLIIDDPGYMDHFFNTIGFNAYDKTMIDQIREVISIAPLGIDYQIDIYEDETVGEIFSLDISLVETAADAVRRSLSDGESAKVIDFLIQNGIADTRVAALYDIATSIAVPEQITDGKTAARSVIIKPAWIKIRWKAGILQNSKCYCMLKSYKL